VLVRPARFMLEAEESSAFISLARLNTVDGVDMAGSDSFLSIVVLRAVDNDRSVVSSAVSRLLRVCLSPRAGAKSPSMDDVGCPLAVAVSCRH